MMCSNLLVDMAQSAIGKDFVALLERVKISYERAAPQVQAWEVQQ